MIYNFEYVGIIWVANTHVERLPARGLIRLPLRPLGNPLGDLFGALLVLEDLLGTFEVIHWLTH